MGRILDSYEHCDKKPSFDATENTFSITLPNMNYQEITDKSNIIIQNLSQEDIIINYLKEYNKISRNIVEKLLNVSKTRAYEILNEMLEKNILKKEDNGKNTYYVLKESVKNFV